MVHLGAHLRDGDCFHKKGIDPLSCTNENIYYLPLDSAKNMLSVSAVFAVLPSKSVPRTNHLIPCLLLSLLVTKAN